MAPFHRAQRSQSPSRLLSPTPAKLTLLWVNALTIWLLSRGLGRYETLQECFRAVLTSLLWILVPLVAIALVAFLVLAIRTALQGNTPLIAEAQRLPEPRPLVRDSGSPAQEPVDRQAR